MNRETAPQEGVARLRAALVGCGRIAKFHAEAVRAVPGAELVAVCDLDESIAKRRAGELGAAAAFSDVERMMAESKPDVVHLLTPPASHRHLTGVVTRHGAHLYVEKPIASSEADAREMIRLAEEAGVQLCPGHNRLFDPPFRKALQRVEAGHIGRVVSVRAEQGFAYENAARAANIPWSYTSDWGIFENLIPHPLYLVSHFLEQPGPPVAVGVDLARIREAAVEEIRVLIPSAGAIGEVVLSLTTAPVQNRLEVVGTRGRLVVDYLGLSVYSQIQTPLPSVVQRLTGGFDLGGQLAGSSLALIFGVLTGRVKQYMGLRALVGEFYRALQAGRPSPVSAAAGLLNVVQLDRIREQCAPVAKRRVVASTAATDEPAPRALVTGASGFLGGRTVERLSEASVPVRATTRLVSRARPIPGVQWVECDLAREDDLRSALRGVRTVFHCAALAGPPGSLADYEEANVRGSVRLAALAAEAGVETLVYLSSLSVYAMPSPGRKYLDESAPYDLRAAERGFYTQSKLGADRAMLEYARDHDRPRIVMLRPGTIYGPGVKLPIARFTLPSPSRERPLAAGGRGVAMPLTYVDNVIDAMLAAERSSAPTGSVFNVVDSPECDQGEVARALKEASGGRIRPVFLPYPLVWSLMLAVDLLALVRRGKPGTARYRLARTLANMRYPCVAAREQLGWRPGVPLVEALRRVLARETESPYPH